MAHRLSIKMSIFIAVNYIDNKIQGKVKIVELHEATNSVVATQQKFTHYNINRSPSSKTSKGIVVKF